MKISLGELSDRYIINIRKMRVITEENFSEEAAQLNEAIQEDLTNIDIFKNPQLLQTYIKDLIRLADINYAIWDMEFELRQGKNKEEDLAIQGARAIKIRDLNAIRINIKNIINSYSKTGFTDIKVLHCSENKSK